MSTDAAADLERRVTDFLARNFPQIRMHGGHASVEDCDPETGGVTIRLGGACGGCGVSAMTARAIRSRLPGAIPGVETVRVETADPESADRPAHAFVDGADIEAPF